MHRTMLVTCLTAVAVSPAFACLWDYDTLQQERSRFPSTLELITGKFLQHSDDFYRWRIADRERRLKSEPDNLALYDDVAVAWDKLGEPDKAVEVMLQKQALKPDEYETLANLGTFHIHAGRLEEGAEFIKQAITINPDAHFGREIYQLKLVEYVLSKRNEQDVVPQPLGDGRAVYPRSTFGFAAFVLSDDDPWTMEKVRQRAAAVKGVLGMMRFGSHDSPILLEALGDLLSAGRMDVDGRQLAARAYLQAAQNARDGEAAASYRSRAAAVASNQHPLNEDRRRPGQSRGSVPAEISVIETELAAEIADAEKWIAEFHARERQWIQDDSVNPDEQFAKLYAVAPVVNTPNSDRPRLSPAQRNARTMKTFLLALTAVVLVVVFAVWRRLQRQNAVAATVDP